MVPITLELVRNSLQHQFVNIKPVQAEAIDAEMLNFSMEFRECELICAWVSLFGGLVRK